MHLHYAVVRTREMGCFKLCGSPIRNGSHSAKRMVASIFSKQDSGKMWSVLVTLSNAIHDQIQVRYLYFHHCITVYCQCSVSYDLLQTTGPGSRSTEGRLHVFGTQCSGAVFWRRKRLGTVPVCRK